MIFKGKRKAGLGKILKFALIFASMGWTLAAQGGIRVESRSAWEMPLKKCWILDEKVPSLVGASDNNNSFILSNLEGTITKTDLQTGTKSWQTNLGENIQIRAVIWNDPNYIISSRNQTDDSKIRAVSDQTGLTIWQTPTPSYPQYLLKTNEGILAIGQEDQIILLNAESGEIKWQLEVKEKITGPPLVKGDFLLLPLEKKITMISVLNGQFSKQIQTPSSPTTALLLEKEELIWGDSQGNLSASNMLKNRQDWRVKVGGAISTISETENGLLVTSLDNYLYFFTKNKGNLKWKQRFPARIDERPLIEGNFAFIKTVGEKTVNVVNIESGRVVNQITLDGDNYFEKSAIISGNLVIFNTSEGIIAYSNSVENCPK